MSMKVKPIGVFIYFDVFVGLLGNKYQYPQEFDSRRGATILAQNACMSRQRDC